MFFLTSKWVYESTEILPQKKRVCKLFLKVSGNGVIFVRFRADYYVFQAFQRFDR